ncbi:hypothetical protein CDD81_994 [Ophiocordyceps australis]|uniref:Uncharacterized protein n=1 Tax=Ophiocordyceps australis TaxID=1399860 RepID=A0A2C5X8B0_9HYPO|nr:hypothetical protein CDD81_994 [Ophiocordyceps australis]
MTTSLYYCSNMLDYNSPIPSDLNTIFDNFDPLPWFSLNYTSRASIITGTLPAELRITIAQSMNWEAATFIHNLDSALDILPNADQIVDWYTNVDRRVCWDKDIKYIFNTHANIASGLADLLVQPAEIGDGTPAKRFTDLPPGYLAANTPHCIEPTNPQYLLLRRLLSKLRLESQGKVSLAPEVSKFREIANEYAHPFIRAVYHASHKSYRCVRGLNCAGGVRRNHALKDIRSVYNPRSFADFGNVLKRALERDEAVCILFADVEVPSGYGAISGKK